MKLTIETSKEVEIELPEYPFYIKILNEYGMKSFDMLAWVKNSASITMCGFDTLYNDNPETVFKSITKEGKTFEIITQAEFEQKVKETIDFLTLIPF